eukprot:8781662-Ditylum_brightwellii.AAC.1
MQSIACEQTTYHHGRHAGKGGGRTHGIQAHHDRRACHDRDCDRDYGPCGLGPYCAFPVDAPNRRGKVLVSCLSGKRSSAVLGQRIATTAR